MVFYKYSGFSIYDSFLYICTEMLKKIYDILVAFLGESKQGGYSEGCSSYEFNCPACAEEKGVDSDGKHNLAVNLSITSPGLVYHCWRCGETNHMKGSLGNLIKRYGNKNLLKQYLEALDDIKNSGLYDINLFTGETSSFKEDTFVKLPKTFKKLDLRYVRSGKLHDYLEKRCITQDLIDKFNIGVTTWDEEKYQDRCRIVFPSYDSTGFLNYWVGRDYTGYEKKRKYNNCVADKKNVVCFEDKIEWDADIYLTEGIFDALHIPLNGVPLLGKTLGRDYLLYQKLYRNANANIIIAIDADTEITEVKRIYKLLDWGRLKGHVRYIRPESGKDFGEIYETEGKEGLMKELRNQKTFTEIELLV